MATTLHKYSEVGLAPQVILAGIGYKDFPTMDSLRTRDYTYPVAIPEYEMSTSGRADRFLSFIDNQLTPFIDSSYKTDTSKRILMGHSLGGYFTLYALSQYLAGNSNTFNGYIAASPSLHYNRYYLLDQLEKTKPVTSRRSVKSYITYGSLEEDKTDTSAMPLQALTTRLLKCLPHTVGKCQVDIYTNLGHMDTQLPTFIKGLQFMNE
jgi:predicted alpha/beta superfamily hydrolase